MKINITLKKCPFCGKEANIVVCRDGGIKIACNECGASTEQLYDEKSTAVIITEPAIQRLASKWNRRVEK